MTNICDLSEKKCTPCHGGIPAMDKDEANKFLQKLKNGWEINQPGHLFKEYKFNNFVDAMDLANKIAIIAEEEGHHPDLTISWGKCGIEIWTHKINGLSESDFILAAKIDKASK